MLTDDDLCQKSAEDLGGRRELSYGTPWVMDGGNVACVHVIVGVLLMIQLAVPLPGHDFCYINEFENSTISYSKLKALHSGNVRELLRENMEHGQLFVVSDVTNGWKANHRWTHEYFKSLFSNFELFSSTFATNVTPVFEHDSHQEDVYFGIFINDPSLANLLASDYSYPDFIPPELRIQGCEVSGVTSGHWGSL